MANKKSDSKIVKLPSAKHSSKDVHHARSKIKTPDELEHIADGCRDSGDTIVLAHGVFDLVHMGHVRHLEAARREGDVLIVSVTADAFVNKGPGRPIFQELMRAEMLAALGYVDWVCVSNAQSAAMVLEKIRPDVYVKGSDYENPDDDVTGQIEVENELVAKLGGRVVLTREVSYSSSSLINKYLDVYDPSLRDFLDEFRERDGLNVLLELIESIKDKRVLLVGDTIIDEYFYVNSIGKSSKENIIATKFSGKESFAGGVIAAANHISNFCKEVEVLTCLGNANSHEELIRKSLNSNVKLVPIHRDDVPTTCKRRYIESSYMQKLFEVYHMDDSPFDQPLEDAFDGLIAERAGKFDLVIVTDFGHGLISKRNVATLCENSKFLAVNTQTNAGNYGYNLITKYPKADFICIDAPEAHLATTDKFSNLTEVAGELLPAAVQCDNIIVTQGKFGCVAYNKGEGIQRVPAFTNSIVDTVGAGDAFFVVTAPLVAMGANIRDVAFIGNAVGAMMVGIVGHRSSVHKVPLIKYITALLK